MVKGTLALQAPDLHRDLIQLCGLIAAHLDILIEEVRRILLDAADAFI